MKKTAAEEKKQHQASINEQIITIRNSDKGITEELKKLQIRQNEIYTELTKAR